MVVESQKGRPSGKMKIFLLYDFLSELGGIERVMAIQARWLKDSELTLAFLYVDDKTKGSFRENYAVPDKVKITEIVKFPVHNEIVKIVLNFLNPVPKRLVANVILSHGFFSSFLCYKLKKLYGQKGILGQNKDLGTLVRNMM